MKRIVPILLLSLVSGGCVPFRIFQSKVPAPIIKSEKQVEAERSAADLIARKIEAPPELKPVAVSLSASLGAPKTSLVDVKAFELPKAATKANDELIVGIRQMQTQLDQLNTKLVKLQGKEVEGTGFSVLGPGISAIVIGLIVLGVVFPPAFTLMGIAYRRTKAAASHIVEEIDAATHDPETKDAVKKIKQKLNARMDTTDKKVIHTLQTP